MIADTGERLAPALSSAVSARCRAPRPAGRPTILGPVAVALLALLGSGCLVGPAYHRPSVETPPAFGEAPPAGWKHATPSDATLRGDWWELFGDPDLTALERQVAVSNQTLAQAEAQFRGARAAVAAARAGLFPTVTGGGSVTRSSGSRGGSGSSGSAGSGSNGGASGSSTIYQVPVDFTWEIDLWGRVRRQVESARATAEASGADVENARLSLQAELAVDWFQLHGIDEQKQLLDATVADYAEALKLTRARHDQGIASGADVAEAETQLESARTTAVDLGVARAELAHAIAILVGKAPVDVTVAPEPIHGEPPAVPLVVPSELLERRPDIAAAERRVAAANADVGVATAAYYPTISLGATVGFASSSLAKLFTAPSRFWSVGPALAATLFDGGRRRALVAQAEASYDATVAGYRETVLTAFQGVEDALAATRILADERAQQGVAVAAARRSLDLTRTRYKGGVASFLEVLTAQNAAYSAERDALDVQVRQMTATVNLVRALGGGWSTSEAADGGAPAASPAAAVPTGAAVPAGAATPAPGALPGGLPPAVPEPAAPPAR